MAEFIEILSTKALADLKTANDEVIKLVSGIDKAGEAMKNIKTPSGSDSALKGLAKMYEDHEKHIKNLQNTLNSLKQSNISLSDSEKKLLNDTKAINSATISNNNAIASTIRLKKQQQQENDRLDKQQARELAKLEAAENLYARIQQRMSVLTKEYNHLATMKQLNVKLTDDEEKRYAFLQKNIQIYDKTLKAVDGTIGKFQRNVGNYPFNPLSNSINQLTREMPAFTNSVQTGFMALSNNIPIFADAIQNAIQQNKELIAQGKPTTSVLRQVAGALLSWQTLMGVGITLLTVYGKEIGEWIGEITKGGKAVDSLKESQKQLNEISLDGQKNAVEETIKLKSLLEIAKDTALSYKQRKIAVDELQSTYPAYFGNLTQEQILAGQTAEAEKSLTEAILSRAKANAAVGKITENQKQIIDIELKRNELRKELKKTEEQLLITEEKIHKSENVTNSEGIALSQMYERRIRLINKINKLSGEKYNLDVINDILTDFAIEKQKEAILLDYKKEKTSRDKIQLNFEEAESLYNLKLARLELQKAEISARMSDEKAQLNNRLKARKQFSEKSIEILNLETDKEKAILLEKYNDDLEKNNLAYKNKDLTAKEWSKNIIDINNRFNNEKLTKDIEYSIKWNSLMREDLEFYKQIEEQKAGFAKSTLDRIFKYEQDKQKKTSENERLRLKEREKAFQRYIQLSKDENEIARLREINQAVDALQVQDINDKYNKLNETLDELSKKESPLKKSQEATDKWLQSISNGQIESALNSIGLNSAKMFLDIDQNGQSTFSKLMEGADTLGEKMAITFKAVGDVAKDVFSQIQQAQTRRFQSQITQLEKEKELAIKFAGDNADARAEIDRQYEAKLREIRIREFKAKKRLAIVEANINIAQGVIASLAKGGTAGIVMAGIIGALGIVQLATIQNQEMPEYWTGTENAKEGLAKTQERGREFIFDKSGKLKSTGSDKGTQITKMDAGDKVWNADKTRKAIDAMMFNDQLNNILTSNGISSPIVNNRLNDERIVDALNSVEFAVKNIPVGGTELRNGEMVNYIQKANTRTILTNNRRTFTPRKV